MTPFKRNFSSSALWATVRMFLLGSMLAIPVLAKVIVIEEGVAIVGGGVAGIMAAGIFSRKNVPWHIFEAKDRLGGRFKTEFFEDATMGRIPIEHGLTYVQGIQGNPFWEAVKRAKVQTAPVNWNNVIVYRNDTVEKKPPFIDFEKGFKCAQETGYDLKKAYFDTGALVSDVPTGREIFEECGWFNKDEVDDAVEFLDMEFEYGRAPEQFSGYAFPEFVYSDFRDGDRFGTDDEGFQKYVDNHIAENLGSDVDPCTDTTNVNVHCNTEVIKIEYNVGDDCMSASTKLTPSCVRLTLKNEDEVYAEFALSTLTFGVIKANHERLLPQGFPGIDLLNKGQMGNYHRTYLQFTDQFMDETEYVLSAKEGQPPIAYKPWDVGHPNRFFPGSTIVQCNAGGDSADVFDLMSDEQLKEYHVKRLTDMYGELPDVTDVSVARWSTDEFTKGAWFQLALDATPEDFFKLWKPAGQLYFSGDSTCFRYYGFVIGALTAAQRDANTILQKLGKSFVPHNRCEDFPTNKGKKYLAPHSKRFK